MNPRLRGVRAAMLVAAAVSLVAFGPGSAERPQANAKEGQRGSQSGGEAFVEWRGACPEVNFVVRTDAANVRSLVAPRYRDNILLVGPPGEEQAVLAFLFIQCPDSELVTPTRSFSTELSHEVTMAVLLAGSEDGDEVQQFYTFVNITEWEPLAASYSALGHPTRLVSRLVFDLRFDPVSGRLASLRVDVPVPNDRLTVTATAGRLMPQGVDAAADEFAHGAHGPLRVQHRAPDTTITPLAVAEITAHNPNGLFATALGRTTARTDAGVFFETGQGHHHRLEPLD